MEKNNNQIEKDLYLRKLSLGEIEGVLSGLPSIDKPWLKYYSEEHIKSILPDLNAYDYLYNKNLKHMGRYALNYFGRKITFEEMFLNIASTEKGLRSLGVKKGDIVSVSLPNTPESVYIFYALSKIGAIANMIDPRTSIKGIEDYINEVGSELLIMIDVALLKVKNIKETTTIKNIVTVSPADSLPLVMNLGFKAKAFFENYKKKEEINIDTISWKEFVELGKKFELPSNVKEEGKSNDPVLIVHTGGTTGSPKGVLLSNKNINAVAHQSVSFPTDLKSTHKWLDIMPPFIAYGIGTGLHFPLSVGMETILIPAFKPEEFDKLLVKYKPNHISGVPSHWNNIINSKKLEKADLSYLISCAVGGDHMDRKLEINANKFLKDHGCKYAIAKGYGMTEVNGSIGRTTNENNPLGSVGIPFVKSVVSIFDPETGKELEYNQIGEICMSGPNIMIGYYNKEEETNKIKRLHEDGVEWVHSGDVGYMTEDGNIFVVDRMKRLIIRHDGFKIFPSVIEKVISNHPNVKACKVVGMTDINSVQGKLPCAFVILKDKYVDYKVIEQEIYQLCEKNLPEYSLPNLIRYKESFPLTPIGKVDYMKLEEEIDTEIKNTTKQKKYVNNK